MAEFFGAIQNALGAALNAIYTVIPSYGVAIILLTVAVRAVLIPLTLKQIRSMTAMQTLAPEQKKIQQKYKQLQAKVQDRQELMKLRQQMNQEIMALFKELNNSGITIIIVTHEHEVAKHASRVFTMRDGLLAGDSAYSPERVMRSEAESDNASHSEEATHVYA